MPRAGAARKRVRSASRPRTWEPGGWPEGVGHLHVLEAPSRIRKPSRERRRESLAGSARTAHGEGGRTRFCAKGVFGFPPWHFALRSAYFCVPPSAFALPTSLRPSYADAGSLGINNDPVPERLNRGETHLSSDLPRTNHGVGSPCSLSRGANPVPVP